MKVGRRVAPPLPRADGNASAAAHVLLPVRTDEVRSHERPCQPDSRRAGDLLALLTRKHNPGQGSSYFIGSDRLKSSAAFVNRSLPILPITSVLIDLHGAIVASIQDKGPAAKAGLGSGDVITSVNGEPIKTSKELTKKSPALR